MTMGYDVEGSDVQGHQGHLADDRAGDLAATDSQATGPLVLDASDVLDDDTPQFFAPVASDVLDGLLGQYQQARQRIDQLAGLANGALRDVVHYFIEGNAGDDRFHRTVYVNKLFQVEGAVKALNSAYWSKAMSLTDVYDHMPQGRRNDWNTAIREHKTPEFTEETVRATIMELLASRQKFFAERVDGIFRALSHEHVTNCPEGFSKRMILAGVLNEWGHVCSSQAGCINDLRAVIARFMGRDEPKHYATDAVVAAARRRTGEWMTVDAGALRIRVYKRGTAHLEVHPQMAYRLNQVLAYLHPAAIPAAFRTKPKKKLKDFEMMGRPLPFAVVELLAQVEEERERVTVGYQDFYRPVRNARRLPFRQCDPAVRREAARVLQALGGVPIGKSDSSFQFDYDPDDVLDEVVSSGCIPDRAAHQFYPTPETVAALAREMADIEDGHTCLEPSAGQGHLAAVLPQERTTCVEISPLHCEILKARGYTEVHQADFLTWAEEALRSGRRWDRIVMNPPFANGRAQAHVEAAARLLAPRGRLTAILPAGMRGRDVLQGTAQALGVKLRHEWSGLLANEFAGTSVAVAVLAATREG